MDLPRPLRLQWAPLVGDPPTRAWSDAALLVGVLLGGLVEVAARPTRPLLPLVVVVVALLVALPRRRRDPLRSLAVVLGAGLAVDVVIATTNGPPEDVFVSGFVLVLVYAVYRWGTARQGLLAALLMLVVWATDLTIDWPGLGDAIGGLFVFFFPAQLGALVRTQQADRVRAVDQARLRERQDLARELHDTVAHHVSAIAVRAQAGRAVAPHDPGAALDALVVIEEEASRTLSEMRAMVGALRTSGDPIDLAPQRSIADLVRLAGEDVGGPRVQVQLADEVHGLGPSLQAALYRLAQESITNARRHARHASTVQVTVDADEHEVRLVVRDDGDPVVLPTSGEGHGLIGMTERARLFGGTLTAGPAPGRGWHVAAVLPRTGASR